MSNSVDRINFVDLALQLGGKTEAVQIPNGPLIQMPVWTDELRGKLFDWFQPYVDNPRPLELDGHPEVWVTLALNYRLRKCPPSMYIGALGGAVKMESFQLTEGTLPENQPICFKYKDLGDNRFYLDITFPTENPSNPLAQTMASIVAPRIPDGMDIIVDRNVSALVYHFNLPATYGEKCRTMYVKDEKRYICCISNTEEVRIGDALQNSPEI